MISVSFYSISDDERVVNKTLGSKIKSSQCVLKENTSLFNPVLKVTKIDFNKLSKINYCYIKDFNRYYYILDIIPSIGGYVEVHCKVDVLKSFCNSILNISTMIERQEFKNSDYIRDDLLPMSVKRNICKKNIGSIGEVTGNNFVLTVAGGNSND